MHISKGIKLTQRHFPLLAIPIILDILSLEKVMKSVRDFSFKFAVPSAVPSISQVLPEPISEASGFQAYLPFGDLEGVYLFLFIILMFLGPFLKGGFLGCILSGIKEEVVNINTFIENGKKFYVRLLMEFLILALAVLCIVPIAFIFGPLFFIGLIGLLILFFFLLFWDYAMVADNRGLFDSAQVSIDLVGSNKGKVLSFILPIMLCSAAFSFVANALVKVSPILAIAAIVIYAFIGTVVVFAMMSYYLDISQEAVASEDIDNI